MDISKIPHIWNFKISHMDNSEISHTHNFKIQHMDNSKISHIHLKISRNHKGEVQAKQAKRKDFTH